MRFFLIIFSIVFSAIYIIISCKNNPKDIPKNLFSFNSRNKLAVLGLATRKVRLYSSFGSKNGLISLGNAILTIYLGKLLTCVLCRLEMKYWENERFGV